MASLNSMYRDQSLFTLPVAKSTTVIQSTAVVTPQSYADLPSSVLLGIFSYLSELESLANAFFSCKKWSLLAKEESTWKYMASSRIKEINAEDLASYKTYLNLYVHLLKSEYYYLPEMYSHIYFIGKRKTAYFNSRSVIVLFPTGDIIQFIVPSKSTVGQILQIITSSLGLESLLSTYNLQKKEGDFARAQWLAKDKNLDDLGIEDRHILRFQQQLFISGQQFNPAQTILSFPQIRDSILTGYYLCSREEAVDLASIQMYATYGRHAEAKMKNIIRSTLPSRLYNDTEIGLEILMAYQSHLEKRTFPTKLAAKKKYIQAAQKLKVFGTSILNLNNTALNCVIGYDDMYIMKSVTGHIMDQWKLEQIESYEVKDNKITLKFGKNNKIIEITPKTNEVMEVSDTILRHLNFLSDCRLGKLLFHLELPVSYGMSNKKTFMELSSTSETVDRLVRSVEKRLKLPRDNQWGLVTIGDGKWLVGSSVLGAYNPADMANGIEYRPLISPSLIQLADGSVFLAYLNYSVPVNEVLEEIGKIIGITATGLGLGVGSNLLSYYSSLSQQGVNPTGEQILNCIHCMLPNHDLTNEISLDLGYSRAKHVVHNFSLPFLSSIDLRELHELEQRIDSSTERPIARLPSIARYLNLITKEVVFSVSLKDVNCQLSIHEDQIRVKNNEGNVTHDWSLPSLVKFTAFDNGISFNIQNEKEEFFFKTVEGLEIHRCITSFIEMVLFKQDRSRHKKKMLPIHDPDHESTVREGRFLADQIFNKLQAKQIEHLDLSWSAIRGVDLQRICNLLSQDECVRHINISGYGYGTNEILNVLGSIQNSKLVESLNLSYCGLDDQAAYFIGEFLQTNKSLKTLNLTLNPYTKTGFQSILSGLKNNTTVKVIHLQIPDLELVPELSYFFDRQYQNKQIR